MKELSIKDKAKAYDEALKRARKINSGEGVATPPNWTICEVIFPELKESEDKQIMKEIAEFIYNSAFKPKDIKKKEKWLTWFEKQESVEEIVERCKTSWYNEGKIQGQIEGLSDEEKYQQGWHDALEKQGKFVEEYEDRLDRCACESFNKGYKAAIEHQKEKQGEWSKEDMDIINGIIMDYEGEIEHLSDSAINEQAKPIYQERINFLNRLKSLYLVKQEWSEEDEQYLLVCKNALVKYQTTDKWDANIISRWLEDKLKDKVQPKPSWSEEDDIMLRDILRCLPAKSRPEYNQRRADWLKSLKGRVQPKQEWSEEDIEMLNSAISFVEHSAFRTIGKGKNNVISWLKSLKERIGRV